MSVMTDRASSSFRGILRFSFVLLVGATSACSGGESGPTEDGAAGGAPAGSGGGSGIEVEVEPIAQAGRVRRLRKLEWARSVRDLFYADEPLPVTSAPPDDPKTEGYIFDGQAEQLQVDPTIFAAYQRAAQEIAETVASDPDLVELIAPEKGYDSPSSRAQGFLLSWLPRAFRRPLTRAELVSYAKVFEVGSVSYPDFPAFEGGLRLVIEAALQSPFFLYRLEFSNWEESDGQIPLDGYERAARLSYLLWGTMPDRELFDAAAEGELDTEAGVAAEVERMLEDPRSEELVQYFFGRALDTERYVRVSPSANFFPDAPANLSELALEETKLFVFNIIFQNHGGVRELLTSRQTFVNASLAQIYGLPADDYREDQFKLVTLDESVRSGFLTQIGFLASHATSVNPDPIHRGVFVGRSLSCLLIKAPPANVPPLPDPEGKSNRELVAAHTEQPDSVCRECHATLINPFGFPFENYDAIGAYRTMDGEHVVDATSSPLIDGVETPVKDAVDLAARLADSRDVHRCMVGRVIEYAQGRKLLPEDTDLARKLGDMSFQQGLSFREVFVKLATSRPFLYRASLASQESP